MAELSDAFKQLDTVGKLRYIQKLGMLGIKTDAKSRGLNVARAV